MSLAEGNQNASEEYSSVTLTCNDSTARDEFLRMIGKPSKGASLLLGKSGEVSPNTFFSLLSSAVSEKRSRIFF